MMEPLITNLEGFDKNGIHCGSAQMRSDGSWLVRIGKKISSWASSEESARCILKHYGAVTITESDGKKE